MTPPPHIVSIVGNDITIDSRVKKTAASAAAAGYRSSIICYTAETSRIDGEMGDVRVVKVPVRFLVRNAPGRTPLPMRPFVAPEMARRRLARRTRQLATKRRLIAEASNTTSRWRRMTLQTAIHLLRINLKLRQEAYRIRSRAHVAWDRLKRSVLRARVKTRNRLFRRFNNPAHAIYDYEMSFGPVIEELRPDLIHAHDFHMIGIAVTAARNLRQDGLDTKVVYDAHELVEGLSYPPRVVADWLAEEKRHIHHVDAVVGVSPQQTARIQERYGLSEAPTVTLNAPVTDLGARPGSSIRDDLGISGSILVYHGNITPQRGVFVLVEALAHLPDDVHVAFVVQADHPLTSELKAAADRIGAIERLHFVDFVLAEHLPAYLATADVAVIPYLPTGNHHKTLPNKLFEALQGGVPVLASDMEALGGFITEHGVGRVFEPGSPTSLAKESVEMLGHIDEYRQRITPEIRRLSSWDSQAVRLAELYGRLLGRPIVETIHIGARDVTELGISASEKSRQKRVAIGPRNMAGQAYMIATAIQASLGIPAFSFAIEREGLRFPIHQEIAPKTWKDPSWQLRQRELLASGFTHVLAESGTGVLGSLNGGFIDEQLPLLLEDGLEVGLIFHGSELRDPRRHNRRPYSPYSVDDELTRRLEQATARLRHHLEGLALPTFVTTPDLLEDIDGTWLPVVIDYPKWSAVTEAFTESVPTVLHLPSRSRLKGSEHIDPVLKLLEEEGKVQYLRPEETIDTGDVIRLVARADIIVDGIVIGAYGVMSCQALAAGRLSIANLSELGPLRAECPIIHADPGTLEGVLREVLANSESWKQLSAAGREYVFKYHSGAYSAETLRPFLGLR
jgi:glycosyltransferase involved in cell wall biosynthesis